MIYWKNVKNSATVLSLSLLALIIVAKYSFISLISHVAIGVLIAFFAFRLYKFIECQIQKKDDVNPFESYLNEEIQLPYDRIHQQIDTLIEHLQIIFVQLRRLFLIEQVSDSIKFFLLLWSLTYIGEWFSAILLLGVFTLPKVYQVHHEIIDHYFAVIKAHVDHAIELYHFSLFLFFVFAFIYLISILSAFY
ncbi:unnamed protein product [Dracunculus medinensis]|uniref:Reticulon-like protein n=1 Tax=Dracunculus medinensis TaxID=318479 RepID=A0A3P7P8V3_DRAME|nr:unnamed protein product [Dracunculus medinensis]